jgi:chromosome segregation ATPase
MSKLYEGFKSPTEDTIRWFLKISGDLVYGPITLQVLCDWAARGRVAAGNKVSRDKESWSPAEDMPDLKMDWTVQLKNGEVHGPFNLLAAPLLVQRCVIDANATLRNRATGKLLEVRSLLKFDSDDPIPDPTTIVAQSAPAKSDTPVAPTPAPTADSKWQQRYGAEKQTWVKKEAELSTLVAELSDEAQSKTTAIQKIQVELQTAQESYRGLKQERAELETQYAARAEKAAQEERVLAARLQELDSKPSAPPEEITRLQKEIDDVKTRLSDSEAKAAARQAELTQEAAKLKQDAQAVTGRFDKAQAAFAALQREHETLQTTTKQAQEQLRRELDARTSETKRATKSLHDVSQTLDAEKSQHEQTRTHLTRGNEDLAQRQNKLDALGQAADAREQELTAQIETLREQAESASANVQQLNSRLTEEKTRQDQAHSALAAKNGELSRRIEELQKSALASSEGLQVARKEIETQAKQLVSLDEAGTKREGQLNAQLNDLKASAQSSETGRAQLEAQIQKQQAARQDATTRATEQEKQLAQRIEELQNEAQASAAQIQDALKLLSTHKSEHVKTKSQATRAGREQESRNTKLEKQLDELDEQLRNAHQKQKASIAEHQRAIESEHQKEVALQKQLVENEGALQELQNKLQQIEHQRATEQAAGRKELADAKTQHQAVIKDGERESKALAERVQSLKKQNDSAEKKIDRLTKAKADAQKKARAAATQQRKIQADYGKDAAPGNVEALRTELEAGHAKRERELTGKISDQDRQLTAATTELERVTMSLDGRRREAGALRDAGQRKAKDLQARIDELEKATGPVPWYLKLDDESVFGPVPAPKLYDWAAQCRIGPDHQLSKDQKTWVAAKDVPDLKMEWAVELVDGGSYGPINMFAVHHLISDGAVAADAKLQNEVTSEAWTADKLLTPEVMAIKTDNEALAAKLKQQAEQLRTEQERNRQLIAEQEKAKAVTPAPAPATLPPKRMGMKIKQMTSA